MKPYIGDAMLLITAIVWGSGFVVTAIALEHLTAFQVMAGRFVLASIILSILFGYKFKYFSKSILTKGAILGAILYTGFALQTVGLEYTTPSKNAFLTAVNVVIVPLIAFAIYKRKISGQEITGAFLALVGVGFMSLEGSLAMNIGDLLSLACAVAFAFDIFYTNMFVKKEDAISLTMVQFMTAAFLSVMTVLIQGDVPVAVEREAVYAIVYLAVFSTTVAYVSKCGIPVHDGNQGIDYFINRIPLRYAAVCHLFKRSAYVADGRRSRSHHGCHFTCRVKTGSF